MNYYNQYPTYQNYGYPQQNGYQQPRQNNIFSLVNGLEEAKAFIVMPNQVAYLLDTNSNHFMIKTINDRGQYKIQDYILQEAQDQETSYVSKNEFLALQQQIAQLSQAVSSLTKKEE